MSELIQLFDMFDGDGISLVFLETGSYLFAGI